MLNDVQGVLISVRIKLHYYFCFSIRHFASHIIKIKDFCAFSVHSLSLDVYQEEINMLNPNKKKLCGGGL